MNNTLYVRFTGAPTVYNFSVAVGCPIAQAILDIEKEMNARVVCASYKREVVENITIHSYVDQLINNEDGINDDRMESSWFTVNIEWLTRKVSTELGFATLEDFLDTYTYDNTIGLLRQAAKEGVLLGCGVGDMREYPYSNRR